MPPLWKILFFCALCLGLAPLRGEESEDPSELALDTAVVESELFEPPQGEAEMVQSEVVSEQELAPVRTSTNLESREPAPLVKASSEERPTASVPFSSEEVVGLEKLGIRKLPQGISIFRYNRQQIKKQVSLLKSRMPIEKSVQ